MFLRKLGKRGAEMVEYAIVLACIAAVGVGFYSSNDSKLTGVLDSLFGNVRQVLGLETATGKHPLKTTGLSVDVATALAYQTSIPYDFITARLGEGEQLEAISFDPNGKVNGIWYSKENELKALEADTVKNYNGEWKSNSESIQGKYYDVWNNTTLTNTGFKKYNANVGIDGMFVAYDKYGNVVQNVNTSGLSGNEVTNVQNKTTNIYLKENNSTIKYNFNDTDGFYVKQTP